MIVRRLAGFLTVILVLMIVVAMAVAAVSLLPGSGAAALAESPPAGGAQAQNPSFNLVNQAAVAIKEVYVTPAGDANWGRNRLEGITIAAGASYAVRRRIDGNCIFDIRVVFTDGKIDDRRGLNTCQSDDVAVGATGTAAPVATGKAADDPSFRLINRGPTPITEAYATPAGLGNWGQNRLEGSPLEPQTDRLIHVDKQGSCRFDLRVVFSTGRKLERRHADLCRLMDLPVP